MYPLYDSGNTYFIEPKKKFYEIILYFRSKFAEIRNKIPNANGGKKFIICVITDKNFNSIESVGFNKYETTINHGTIHAEIDAFLKLKKQKSVKKINVMIFRTNKDNQHLMLSKCCENCLYSMKLISEKKKYKIINIYYTNEFGDITKI
jgi:hypothetical protein